MKVTKVVFLNTASLLNTKYTLLKLLEELFGSMIWNDFERTALKVSCINHPKNKQW